MYKKILYLLLTIIPFSFLYSFENNLKMSTNVQIKDKIPLIKSTDSKIHLYFFIDEISCFTCIESMKNVSKFLTKEFNTNIVVFINANEDFDTLRFRNNTNWKYPIILDYIGAYKNHYGVKQLPLMYIADKDGVVEYIGIPGSAKYFDADSIYNKAKFIQNKNNDDFSINGLKFLKKENIFDKNKMKIKLKEPFSGYTNPNNNGFVVSCINNNIIYVIDSNNILIREYQLDSFNIDRHALVHGNVSNNDIYIYTISSEGGGTIYKINLFKNNCDSIIKCDYNLQENTLPWFSVRLLNDSVFLINQSLYNYKKSNGFEPSIRVYSVGNKKYHYDKIGRLDPHFSKYYLANYFGSDFCFDNYNNIYEFQYFSDSIHYYDLKENQVNSYSIKFDSIYYNYNWKTLFEGIDENTDLEIRKTFRFKISNLKYGNALIYDKTKDEILIFYGNRDPKTEKQILHFNRFNKNNLNHNYPDIKIPDDCLIMGVNDGIITFLRTIDGLSYIVDYSN